MNGNSRMASAFGGARCSCCGRVEAKPDCRRGSAGSSVTDTMRPSAVRRSTTSGFVVGIDVGATKTHLATSGGGVIVREQVVRTSTWRTRSTRQNAAALAGLVREHLERRQSHQSARSRVMAGREPINSERGGFHPLGLVQD